MRSHAGGDRNSFGVGGRGHKTATRNYRITGRILFSPFAAVSSYFGGPPAHEWHHHDRDREAGCDDEVGVGESLDLRFPVGRLPQFLERRNPADRRIAPGLGIVAGQPAADNKFRTIRLDRRRVISQSRFATGQAHSSHRTARRHAAARLVSKVDHETTTPTRDKGYVR
jgi:hypothetical protein